MTTHQNEARCGICKAVLDQSLHADCGGDCLLCMAEAGDPGVALEVIKILKAQRNDLLTVMKQAKYNLMHQRRFGTESMTAWRNAAAYAEGDLEDAINKVEGRA